MLKRIWSTLCGYTTISANSTDYCFRGQELVVFTNSKIRRGDRVRVELPQGKRVLGRAAWHRDSNDHSGTENRSAIGITLPQGHGLLGDAQELEKMRYNERFAHRQWVSFPKLRGLGTVTLDLSIEGCRIAADLSELVGETHNLRLELPGSATSISVQAKILWSRKGEAGLRFLNMHIRDEAALAKSLGLETFPAEETWSSIWRRSQTTLSFRITPVTDDSVTLDFETPNWLATFELEHWCAKGPWTGTFAHVETSLEHTELAALRQKLGVDLERRKSLVHLTLLDFNNEVVLTVWGVERSFRRTQRGSECRVPGELVLDSVEEGMTRLDVDAALHSVRRDI